MRRFAEGFLLPASFVALASTVQPAAAGKYCLQGRQWGYPGNCQFSTYRQCMATASGTDAGCGRLLQALMQAAASIRNMRSLACGGL